MSICQSACAQLGLLWRLGHCETRDDGWGDIPESPDITSRHQSSGYWQLLYPFSAPYGFSQEPPRFKTTVLNCNWATLHLYLSRLLKNDSIETNCIVFSLFMNVLVLKVLSSKCNNAVRQSEVHSPVKERSTGQWKVPWRLISCLIVCDDGSGQLIMAVQIFYIFRDHVPPGASHLV